MTRPKAAAYATISLFFSIWAICFGGNLKFADYPYMIGPALGVTLVSVGIGLLFAALYFAIFLCAGEEA